MPEKEIHEAIKLIKAKTVYRNTNLTDKSGFFIATNDPEKQVWEWSYKKILKLAEIVKNKPEAN